MYNSNFGWLATIVMAAAMALTSNSAVLAAPNGVSNISPEEREERNEMIAEVRSLIDQVEGLMEQLRQKRLGLIEEIDDIRKGDYEHDDSHHGGGHMGNYEYMGMDVPTIDILFHDTKKGYNLEIVTENFTFTPENEGEAHVDNEGHTHLYIDGVKITRVYSPWYYLTGLEPGVYEVRVELSTNDHKAYAYQGEIIDVTKVIVVE